MSPSLPTIANAAEVLLLLAGCVMLWRFGLSPAARRAPARVPPWDATLTDFFLFLWFVVCGGLLAPFAAGLWLKRQSFDPDLRLILTTAAFQLGLLAGVLLFRFRYGRTKAGPPNASAAPNPLLAGLVTYLAAVPVIVLVSLVWQTLLNAVGIPTPPQDAIELLRNSRSSLPVGILVASATIVAPVSEELIFRAGIFRYARTRLPRWAALLLPACIFGAMHTNLASLAPLVALGVVFSLAYERTGRISTTIVAHALFNLTTTLLIFAGVDV
ncbi:MAG: CPBP family intramembrane metalloprotease [Verrucomicrobia bacterium]|nr:CPBP family intramembrane metalloprotease [Verrucomicrobiota bacterium]